MKVEQFRTMMSLTKVQPWLEERTEALYNLLYKDCSGSLIPDTILGGNMTSNEVFNDKRKKRFYP